MDAIPSTVAKIRRMAMKRRVIAGEIKVWLAIGATIYRALELRMKTRIQMSFATPPSVLPLARAGRLKVIAVTSARRSPLFPDLPTVAEGGASGYDYTFSFGLFGPAGLPEPIVARLFEASRKVLADPALRATLEASGNEAAPSESPAAYREWVEADGARERELSIAAGAGK